MRTAEGSLEASDAGSETGLAEREERFSQFVSTHRERAVRLAWRLVGGDPTAAEDVTQEALLKAHRALPRFREEATLETWFYRILIRQAHSYRRWHGVRSLWTDSAATPEDHEDPRAVDRGDPGLRRRIASALDRLTRRQREVFILVHLEGHTVGEAAKLLRMPTGTLKSHLHRALRSLRAELADLQGPAHDLQDPAHDLQNPAHDLQDLVRKEVST